MNHLLPVVVAKVGDSENKLSWHGCDTMWFVYRRQIVSTVG